MDEGSNLLALNGMEVVVGLVVWLGMMAVVAVGLYLVVRLAVAHGIGQAARRGHLAGRPSAAPPGEDRIAGR